MELEKEYEGMKFFKYVRVEEDGSIFSKFYACKGEDHEIEEALTILEAFQMKSFELVYCLEYDILENGERKEVSRTVIWGY